MTRWLKTPRHDTDWREKFTKNFFQDPLKPASSLTFQTWRESLSGSGPFGTLAFGTGMLFDLDKVLVGGSAIQRRVRAHVVVEELVLGELRGDVGDGEGAVVAAPELDAGGPVGPLDAAVELGAFAAAGRGGGCAGPRRPARSRP